MNVIFAITIFAMAVGVMPAVYMSVQTARGAYSAMSTASAYAVTSITESVLFVMFYNVMLLAVSGGWHTLASVLGVVAAAGTLFLVLKCLKLLPKRERVITLFAIAECAATLALVFAK